MINISIDPGNGLHPRIAMPRLFASISETKEEDSSLERLCAETKHYCANFQKTGLWLVLEYTMGPRKVAVFRLGSGLTLRPDQEISVKSQIQKLIEAHENLRKM